MMRHLKSFVFLTVTLCIASTQQSNAIERRATPIKVEIFYETLNDAVRKYFVEQFRLVSDYLLDDIDLRLYPYGNTKLIPDTGEGVTFNCTYGDLQCRANKIHACLIQMETPLVVTTTEPPPTTDTETPEPTTITTDPPTVTPDPITTTVTPEPTTITTDPPTVTPDPITTTVTPEPTTITTDPPTVTPDPITTTVTPEPTTITTDPPTVSPDPITTTVTPEPTTITTEPPTVTPEPTTITTEPPTVTPEPTTPTITTPEPTTEPPIPFKEILTGNNNLIRSGLNIKSSSSSNLAIPDKPINAKAVSDFLNCFFKNRYALDSVDDLAASCMPADGDADWTSVHSCVQENGTINEDLDAITRELPSGDLEGGWAVRINNIVSEDAKTNLIGTLCQLLDNEDGICEQKIQPEKVRLAVYYEAFNLDVGNYLEKQLGTYYHVLEDFVDLELIPYGNTQLIGADSYNCSLGETQCISNKFQALVVDAYINKPKNGDPVSGPNRAVNFISCLFQSANSISAIEACANQKLELDDYRKFIEYIKMDSVEVKTAFDRMKNKTLAAAPNGLPRVPLITLNEQIDYNAFDDLVQEACAQYSGVEKAGICTKVNITVLYEALNHKSRTLILEQLKPVFGNLYNLINLQLIPAGRAVIAPGHGFACPGGLNQCNAMKLQACTLDFFWNDGNNYTDPIRQEVFDFLWCVTKNKRMANVMDAAEICSEEYLESDAWFTIHGCYIDGTAEAIFAEYIEETQSIIQNVTNHAIPIVLINDQEVTDLTSIEAQVCALYDDYHKPDYCFRELPAKVKVQIFYESMSELSQYFFTTQFDPWYIYIEELASIELYPAGNVLEQTASGGNCDSDAGDSTCMANKLQALIIDRYFKSDDDGDFIDGTLRAMEFLKCVFSHPNWNNNIYLAYEYCSEETLIYDDWYDLLITAKSPEGAAIYLDVLDITGQFKKDNGLSTFDIVPWVTLDNSKHSKRAQDDLLQTVCNQYPGDKPLECIPVEVEVYYSGINPQSRRFFLDQLIPTFRNLRERIHLQLIPYGVVDPSLTIEQECAAKDKICLANKAQACAVNKIFNDDVIDNSVQWDGRNQTLTFIYCMFKNIDDLDIYGLAEECANRNIILADEIMACTHQSEGDEYLSGMRNKTMGQYQTMEHAPWIVINGLRSSLAESNLKQAVCDVMEGDKPNYCYEATPAKVKVQFHYSSMDSNSANYVINELYPHYRLLEDIIDVDPIPFGLTEVLSTDSGNYTLICPGGVNECRGNLIHACLYHMYFHNDDDPVSDNQNEYDGKLQYMQFLDCYFKSGFYVSKPIEAAESCVEQVFNDVWSTVKECAHTNMGIQFLLDFQEKKVAPLLPHLTYVPWMTVNGRHSYSIEHHIQRAVCDAFTGREKPQDCYGIIPIDEKPVVYIHYEPGDVGSKDFFASSMMPDHIDELAKVTLVPFGRSTYTDTTKNCPNDATCKIYMEHACISNLFMETFAKDVLQTIACTFGDLMNDANVVNECVNQYLEVDVPDPWGVIETCVQDKGDALMKENAAIAQGLKPQLSHVPWVMINDEHDLEAEVSLCNEVCSVYYPADKPALCTPTLLPVSVYYETSNTDVSAFFLTQLPQYTEYLDEIGNFTFIPYGATTNNNGQFTCTMGDNQCFGNRVHTCVLNRFFNRSASNTGTDYYLNRIRTAGFLICTFTKEIGSSNPSDNANVCLDENFEGDYWRDIHFCAQGPEGDVLYAEMGRQTDALNPKLTSAPVVTINSIQNSNALKNLFQALCNSYSMVRAPLCATLPSLAVKVGIYFSGNAAGQKYLIDQVLPFYKEIVPVLRDGTNEAKLHSLITPDLVAWGDTKYDSSNTANPFTCTGGANECYINRLFACVNNYHGTEPKATLHIIEFALCFFSQSNALTSPTDAANVCANRVWLLDPFPQLEKCATDTTPEAYDIFLKMKSKTENNYPVLTSFPSITINNLLSTDAGNNLLASVCVNYQGYDSPADCDEYLPGTTTQPTTGSGSTGTTGTGTASTGTTGTGTASTGTSGTGTTQPPTTPPGGTTPPPTGLGTTPLVSIFVLFVSLIISRVFF